MQLLFAAHSSQETVAALWLLSKCDILSRLNDDFMLEPNLWINNAWTLIESKIAAHVWNGKSFNQTIFVMNWTKNCAYKTQMIIPQESRSHSIELIKGLCFLFAISIICIVMWVLSSWKLAENRAMLFTFYFSKHKLRLHCRYMVG